MHCKIEICIPQFPGLQGFKVLIYKMDYIFTKQFEEKKLHSNLDPTDLRNV